MLRYRNVLFWLRNALSLREPAYGSKHGERFAYINFC